MWLPAAIPASLPAAAAHGQTYRQRQRWITLVRCHTITTKKWISVLWLHINYHRRRLHGGDGGDRPHSQKVVGRCPQVAPTGTVFWNSKMSHLLHLGVRFKPFAIKLNNLSNILHTMYCLLHSVISVEVHCFAFSLLTSQIQFSVHA